MFLDPNPITISSVTTNLPRVSSVDLKSIYRNADGTIEQIISHQEQGPRKGTFLKRWRHRFSATLRKVVSDPANSETQGFDSVTVEVAIDRPLYGFSVTEVDALVQAIKGQLTTATVTKLYGTES
jgi:hypothetical protein